MVLTLTLLQTVVTDFGGGPERSAVVVNGLMVAAAVLQEVGVVVVNFGIMRQSLDTRAEIWKNKDLHGNLSGESS